MTKILITEDDETIRTALAVILSDNGLCPITASSCEQALQLFDECDLCLLDLMLPGGSGTALYGLLGGLMVVTAGAVLTLRKKKNKA